MSKKNGRKDERKFIFDEDKMFQKLVDSQGRSKSEAFEEIIQNALDSEAENIYIVINDNGVYFVDDGIGMDMEIITKYFEVIGSSSKFDDNTKIGKHGIGFLKFMKYGIIYVRTQDYLLEIDVAKQGRNYKIAKCKHYYNGTAVTLKYYQKFVEEYSWSVKNRIRDIKNLLYTKDRNIVINGVKHEKEVRLYTDVKHEDYEVFREEDGISKLYSQGLLVNNNYGVVGGFSVNCKNKMPLDFGRKGVVDSPEKDELRKFVGSIETSYIINRKRFSKEVGMVIRNRLMSGDVNLRMVEDKQIFRTSNGSPISLTQICMSKDIYFASEGDRLGDLALVKGYLVIDSDFKNVLKDNIALRPEYSYLSSRIHSTLPDEIMCTEDDKVFANILETLSAKLHKIYVYGIDLMHKDLFANYNLREIKFGESKSKDAWTDGNTYIVINKKFISKRATFEKIAAKVYFLLCHEYSHDTASFDDDRHSPEFYERFHKINQATIDNFGEWLGNNRYNKIAKLAEYDKIL